MQHRDKHVTLAMTPVLRSRSSCSTLSLPPPRSKRATFAAIAICRGGINLPAGMARVGPDGDVELVDFSRRRKGGSAGALRPGSFMDSLRLFG